MRAFILSRRAGDFYLRDVNALRCLCVVEYGVR